MKIKIIDTISPESIAMMQAFYSRSHLSIDVRINDLSNEHEIKQTLGKYYIGYGHDSIGDCGTTTIFLEGVSLLAAKVFQDNSLYNGQESSTRYIDFTNQLYVDPADYGDLPTNNTHVTKLLNFYHDSRDELIEHINTKYPNTTNDPRHYKTVEIKAFDILRGFLPSATKTQLSWHTTLRKLRERLIELYNHPVFEIRFICKNLLSQCVLKYPNTFKDIDVALEATKEFNYQYYSAISLITSTVLPITTNIQHNLTKVDHIACDRLSKKEAPAPGLALCEDITCTFMLDFASARDLLRHRRGYLPLPLLSDSLGFNEWYLQQLPPNLKENAIQLLNTIAVDDTIDKYTKQYFLPIGYNVPIIAKWSLPQSIYITELRSSTTVHPTLRVIAQELGTILEQYYPNVNIYTNHNPNDFDLHRADQDILVK
jgi:thymidylate synthase ThyX